ncbi:MAG: hypothetical protein JNL57_10040 [Bacteroidetes bacterium]|nr:hypothetical protein [Bacteroidota bacterium]
MMKLARITALALAGTLVFSSCKYKDGPKVSLRSKRDRVSNEWKIDKMTWMVIDDQGNLVEKDVTSDVNSDTFGFSSIFTTSRTGSYSFEMMKVVKDSISGKTVYISNHVSNNSIFLNQSQNWDIDKKNNYIAGLPEPLRAIGMRGTWSFNKGHTKIQVFPELSYDPNEGPIVKNQIEWVITMLKQKEMHVRGNDNQGHEFKINFKRINDEPYWF